MDNPDRKGEHCKMIKVRERPDKARSRLDIKARSRLGKKGVTL